MPGIAWLRVYCEFLTTVLRRPSLPTLQRGVLDLGNL